MGMKHHNWKLTETKWAGPETVFVWKCPGCGLRQEVFAPRSVGEHAAKSYTPIRGDDCEETMVKIIMES
jgi:hypothetical protein